MKILYELLKMIENKIDEKHEEQVFEKHKSALNFENNVDIPVRVLYPSNEFELFSMSEIHEDMEKMMYNELVSCMTGLDIKDDSIPMIRANYGVGIASGLFGVKSIIVNENMPWVDPISID